MARTVTEKEDLLPILSDIFFRFGYDGASLSLICRETGLGRGSIYHFFPGGKKQMANAVLEEARIWFDREIFSSLESSSAKMGLDEMFLVLLRNEKYLFLPAIFSQINGVDNFSQGLKQIFSKWLRLLTTALMETGHARSAAWNRAEELISLVQGAFLLARETKDARTPIRILKRARKAIQGEYRSGSTKK